MVQPPRLTQREKSFWIWFIYAPKGHVRVWTILLVEKVEIMKHPTVDPRQMSNKLTLLKNPALFSPHLWPTLTGLPKWSFLLATKAQVVTQLSPAPPVVLLQRQPPPSPVALLQPQVDLLAAKELPGPVGAHHPHLPGQPGRCAELTHWRLLTWYPPVRKIILQSCKIISSANLTARRKGADIAIIQSLAR